MASKREATIKFRADTSEFQQQITQSNSKITALKSGVKLLDAEMKNGGASVDLLRQKQSLLAEQLEQSRTKTAALEAKLDAARQVFGEKIGDGRHAGLPLAHEFDGAARELLPGLQEVAPVRPERGAIRQHNERSRRAGEAREPRARLEEAAHIFRAVEVTGCDDVTVHPGIAQLFAQGGELFGGLHKIQRPCR